MGPRNAKHAHPKESGLNNPPAEIWSFISISFGIMYFSALIRIFSREQSLVKIAELCNDVLMIMYVFINAFIIFHRLFKSFSGQVANRDHPGKKMCCCKVDSFLRLIYLTLKT